MKTNLDFLYEELNAYLVIDDISFRRWVATSREDGKKYVITANNKNNQKRWLYSVFHFSNGRDAKNYPRDIRDLAHGLCVHLSET